MSRKAPNGNSTKKRRVINRKDLKSQIKVYAG